MKTGVSDEIERRKRKEYQFANKPTQDNPFVAPVKYINGSHQKRLLENYKMTTVQDSEEFTVQLTPCRWDRTGWKYRRPEERQGYFNHPNKSNFHGHSNQRMYTPSKTNRTLKKPNFLLFVCSGKNQLMATRGLPHTGSATWIGRMKPSLAAGFERRTSNAATPCDSRSR